MRKGNLKNPENSDTSSLLLSKLINQLMDPVLSITKANKHSNYREFRRNKIANKDRKNIWFLVTRGRFKCIFSARV